MNRKAKIVATIGPASQTEIILEELIQAGMNVARMNFSHGTHEEHAERIAAIRRISEKLNISIGILQDLQGPKIRVGELPAPLQLSEGEMVHLYATGSIPPSDDGQKIPVDFRQLFDSVRTSDRLLLDDGRLTLEVVSVCCTWASGGASTMGSFGNSLRRALRRSKSSRARRYWRSDWAW